MTESLPWHDFSRRDERKQYICIHVGQAGLSMGTSMWELFAAESKLSMDGTYSDDLTEIERLDCDPFFEERTSYFRPRALFVDFDADSIANIRKGSSGELFEDVHSIGGTQDASSNFARGYYTLGKNILDEMLERIEGLMEACDSCNGILLTHSITGGTGGGVTSILLERLAIATKIPVINLAVFPSKNTSNQIVEPYNAVLAMPQLVDKTSLSILVDNESLGNLVKQKAKVAKPDFTHLNQLLAIGLSPALHSTRYHSVGNLTFTDLQQQLIAFPRLHFLQMAHSPICRKQDSGYATLNDVVDEVYQPKNMMISHHDWDTLTHIYFGELNAFRGDLKKDQVEETLENIREVNSVNTNRETGTTEIIQITPKPDTKIPDHFQVGTGRLELTQLANNTGMGMVFGERLCRKFDLMQGRKAYLHWYLREGMEEAEMLEARNVLTDLTFDYQCILNGNVTLGESDIKTIDYHRRGSSDGEFWEEENQFW